MTLTDQEYLNNPVIKDVTYSITNDKIIIECPSTSFCQATRITEIISLTELLNTYKNIIKEGKNRKYKFSYKQKTKESIINDYNAYIEAIQNSNKIFDHMVIVAKQIQERQLHYGCSDDMILNELHKLSNEHKKIFYGGTAYSKITGIKYKLEQLENDLKQNYEYMKIFL
jgi:hypothetical protein